MKKTVIKAFCVMAILAFASSAFAEKTFDSSATVIGGGTFKTSTNVIISAESDGKNYAATAAHTQGKKQYGTLSTDPKIYVSTTEPNKDTGPTAVSSPTALPDDTFK